MTFMLVASSPRVPTLVYISISLVLSVYIVINDFKRNPMEFRLGSGALRADVNSLSEESSSSSLARPTRDAAICSSVLGHLPERPRGELFLRWKKPDPWEQMKWIGKPARCRVKGQLIENLDELYNFRRGYALKFVSNVEDKAHLLPWLLASRLNLNLPERRVYLDLGANALETSIQWFMRSYPCDFTEVHAFEISHSLKLPPEMDDLVEQEQGANNRLEIRSNSRAIAVKETPGIPKWMLKRMTFYNNFVSDVDDEATKALNITRFMKQKLKLKASDTVVVKMDIESSEWPILERWLHDPDMPELIDELFVELHYMHPSMSGYDWDAWAPRTRIQATHLLASMRSKGFFVHPWP
ncbi:unnamed protein product [Sphagnum jensenii]|uniref:Methyltransferase FkbM domain-containing protein n=1 Tax=Sphagnum jensenii TaxID=128206 RepID=A0ABP1ATV4_9BRYO